MTIIKVYDYTTMSPFLIGGAGLNEGGKGGGVVMGDNAPLCLTAMAPAPRKLSIET